MMHVTVSECGQTQTKTNGEWEPCGLYAPDVLVTVMQMRVMQMRVLSQFLTENLRQWLKDFLKLLQRH